MILGRKIRLRAIEREDLPRFVQWFNDPQVREGLNLFLPMSHVEEERWFEGLSDRDPMEKPFALDIRQGEAWIHVGSCGLFSLNLRTHSAELGIAIGDKRFWDQGFGTDAVETLLTHAFNTMNMNRVSLRVFESNQRAIEVYRRVGFIEEGRLREDRFAEGRYEDTLIMGILRREWQSDEEGRR